MPWLCAVALTAALLPSVAFAQSAGIADQFINRVWGTGDGLPQNTVTTMLQTRDGYLWLGTFGGLVRFDGHTFTVFNPGNTPGLINSRIVALLEDSKGVLWIGTEGGLIRNERGRFTSFSTAEGLPHRGILSLHEDPRGMLVGTGAGLVRFDGSRFSPVSFNAGESALTMAETAAGEIWISSGLAIRRYSPGTDTATLVELDRGPGATTTMLVDRKGRLWAGGNVLRRWNGTALEDVPMPFGLSVSISALVEDRDGAIWIATRQQGIYRWRDGLVDRYTTREGLTNDFVRSLAVDRDGNIWIGTDVGGLNRLKPRRVHSYPRAGVLEQSIGPIVDDGKDGLWLGATCGGLLHFRNGVFTVVDPVRHGIPNNCHWALLRDGDTLWAGSMGAGLLRLREGRFTVFDQAASGLPIDLALSIAKDRDGVIWVGTDYGVSRLDGNRFTNFGKADGIAHTVLTMSLARDGTLWLGGVGGLTAFKDGRVVRSYSMKDGLSHNHVRAIYEDADGVLWIGTYGGGLNRLKDGRFTTIGIGNGLHDAAVSRIIEDERGNLWMSGNTGVYRVARSQLNAFCDGRASYVTSVSYGTADGMIIDETNGGQPAGWRTADGKLWFPTIKGLVSIDPGDKPATHPPVFIEHIVVNGRPTDRDVAAEASGRADAEFQYTAVDLTTAEKTRFKYRLDGYDRAWIESGTRRIAFYTNIPPGRYTFEAIATNGDGEWSQTGARYALIVLPLWWQRLGVQAVALVMLLLATGVGVRAVSLRRARARLAALEQERALDRERSRIARDLHDDLGSRLTRIALMAGAKPGADPAIADAARTALQTMDELVWAVNARNDTVEGFALYVSNFAEEHVAAAGIRLRLVLPAEPSTRLLPADVRRHLYLACKEAINNAVKHARATEIKMTLTVDRHRLQVEVADNGRGLPREIDPTGNGLKNYRERMEAVRGDVRIESAPEAGTRIVFSVPLA